MHPIYISLFKERIQSFFKDFDRASKNLYYDESSEKLIHPGEFGSYREGLIRDLLREMIPEIYGVSHGFIISPKGETSKQCDVVIYHKNHAPVIRNPEHQRFFTAESVVVVGEIKSDLTPDNLRNTISNLSTIKKYRTNIPHPAIAFQRPFRNLKYEPFTCERDQIGTFLLCSKLDFSTKLLLKEIDKFSDHPSFRLNLLSTLDGICTAYQGEKYIEMYPTQPEYPNQPLKATITIKKEDPISPFFFFINSLFNIVRTTTVLNPELNDYLDINSKLSWSNEIK